MEMAKVDQPTYPLPSVPWFGACKMARTFTFILVVVVLGWIIGNAKDMREGPTRTEK